MAEKNTVAVKIYGQEYSISGEMPRENIMKLADYVDTKMREISSGVSIPMSSVAVLAAVNIADELMNERNDSEKYRQAYEALSGEASRYEQLWEDAKKSIAQMREKEQSTTDLYSDMNELRKQNETLKTRISELSYQLENTESTPAAIQERIEQLQAKCRDTESSFFDLQMENIQLKKEIEKYRHPAGGL